MVNHNGSWQKIRETASSRRSAGELRERIYGKRNAATSLRHGRRRMREMSRKWPKIVTKRLMAKFMATNRIHVCNMEQRMGTILGENERNWSPS